MGVPLYVLTFWRVNTLGERLGYSNGGSLTIDKPQTFQIASSPDFSIVYAPVTLGGGATTMENGFVIDGRQIPGYALYPWSVASLARALLFYAQGRPSADRHTSAAVASYYTLFHLGQFLIYAACPKHQNADLQKGIQKGLSGSGKGATKSWTNDPGFDVTHKMIECFLRHCQQSGLPSSVFDAFVGAQKLRDFINYGPRVDWRHGDFYADTCEHSTSELAPLQRNMERHFQESIRWACREGAQGGTWVPGAIGDVEQYFTGPTRLYGDWCTDDEAQVAESLRASLYDEASRAVHPNLP